MDWQQQVTPVALRTQPLALLLTAAAPWFLNSLHMTPDTGPSCRELISAICPHWSRDALQTLPERLGYPGADLDEGDSFYGLEGEEDEGPFNRDLQNDNADYGFTGPHDRSVGAENVQEVLNEDVGMGDDERNGNDRSRDSSPSIHERATRELSEAVSTRGARIIQSAQLPTSARGRRGHRNLGYPDATLITRPPVARPRVPVGWSAEPDIPVHAFGIYFIRDLMIGEDYPAPRFKNQPNYPGLTTRSYKFFFGMSFEDLTVYIEKSSTGRTANFTRLQNRKPPRLVETLLADPDGCLETLSIRPNTIRIKPRPRD